MSDPFVLNERGRVLTIGTSVTGADGRQYPTTRPAPEPEASSRVDGGNAVAEAMPNVLRPTFDPFDGDVARRVGLRVRVRRAVAVAAAAGVT